MAAFFDKKHKIAVVAQLAHPAELMPGFSEAGRALAVPIKIKVYLDDYILPL
jgi:hypothetical protein